MEVKTMTSKTDTCPIYLKEIEGYEGRYYISPCGKVWSNRGKGRFLKPASTDSGYLMVNLLGNNHYIHRLVAQAYLNNTDKLPQVNHKDEDKSNNHVDNLEWCSHQYNTEYSHAKTYQFICPDGQLIEVFNLRKFCRENNLQQTHMCQVAKGKAKSHKGYTKA